MSLIFDRPNETASALTSPLQDMICHEMSAANIAAETLRRDQEELAYGTPGSTRQHFEIMVGQCPCIVDNRNPINVYCASKSE